MVMTTTKFWSYTQAKCTGSHNGLPAVFITVGSANSPSQCWLEGVEIKAWDRQFFVIRMFTCRRVL
jgi:hypothetical protein